MGKWSHYQIVSVEKAEDGNYPLWRLRVAEVPGMNIRIDRRKLPNAPQPGERVSVNWEQGPNFTDIAYGERVYTFDEESEAAR